MTPELQVRSDDICLATPDGARLAATLLRPAAPRLAVLISAATGYPRRFYAPFAAWLAGQGTMVLTYDYRGVGGSSVPDLARSGIDIPDWGRDLSAAAAYLAAAAPGLPLAHVGHSVGGHLPGLAENHALISRHAFLAVGSGYWGHHAPRYWPMELYFWWGLGSWSLLRHGHLKTGGGWAGEPLPPRAFRTWRRWSMRPGYLGPDLGTRLAPQWFAQVRAPIRFWSFADDPIATPRATETIRALYASAPGTVTTARAADYGLTRLGHDGAFRPGREAVWTEIRDWLSG